MAALGWLQFLDFAGSAALPPSSARVVRAEREALGAPLLVTVEALALLVDVIEEQVA